MDDPAITERHAPPCDDVCLMLRAHAEHGWLSREVLPVVLELESPDSLAGEELSAALAYLEVMWTEALLRARQTDVGHARLGGHPRPCQLTDHACRYHASVRLLREDLAGRVAGLLQTA